MTINDGPLYSPSSIVLSLFSPIFLFHRRELDRGGVEGGHFEIHTAIGTDDDFTNFGASLQLDLGFAFRAGYSRHCLYSFDFAIPSLCRYPNRIVSDLGSRISNDWRLWTPVVGFGITIFPTTGAFEFQLVVFVQIGG